MGWLPHVPTTSEQAATENFQAIQAQLVVGVGSPAGKLAAPVGTIYVRRDGTAGATLYVKESGGSTAEGWVATVGEPGAWLPVTGISPKLELVSVESRYEEDASVIRVSGEARVKAGQKVESEQELFALATPPAASKYGVAMNASTGQVQRCTVLAVSGIVRWYGTAAPELNVIAFEFSIRAA